MLDQVDHIPRKRIINVRLVLQPTGICRATGLAGQVVSLISSKIRRSKSSAPSRSSLLINATPGDVVPVSPASKLFHFVLPHPHAR